MYSGNPNLYRELNTKNLIPRMEAGGLFGPGHYIDVEDKKLHKFPAIDTETRWIYVNPNPKMYCMEYQAIVRGFGFIPARCLECYKVVVAPRSFHELMLLLDLQEEMIKDNPRCWCKCGIEKRDFVPRHYGGYFYNKGLETGKTRYKTVREKVSEVISPDVPVILKRYCTEFEIQFGPSDKYERPPGAAELEKEFWKNIDITVGAQKQPQMVKDNIIQAWMMFAWGRGDKTVTLYNNGQPLFPDVITYHGR